MSLDPYSAAVRRLFQAPSHGGRVPDGACIRKELPDLKIELSAASESGRITQIAFRAFACPHLIAACESLCDAVEGQALDTLEDFNIRELQEKLAIPTEKTGRLLVLEDALVALKSELTGRNV